ncbi:unnamed protein product [Psylliodes chrysocephalus]|uniref:Uncharacterized protein n=1 Tax=Psylliodes chrysocephalus TaxID=3402493 RepID=A0A9P0GIX4_9CUCU|nr:unnamed protein product [Psylliodes chrysocephala]
MSSSEKKDVITEQRVHKLKAKAFFNLLKSPPENVAVFSFDCEKNLPLPKLPDQASYFTQQINYYNFTVVRGSSTTSLVPENVYSYVWTEVDFAKNSNSTASAVWDALVKSSFLGEIDTIHLFADGCGRQNKNSIMMTMLSVWLMKKAPQNGVRYDCEKEVKKKSVVVKPSDYEKIIAHRSTIRKLGVDWQVYDWKSEAQTHMKTPSAWHFQFNKKKRFVFTRGKANVLIRGESNYYADIGEAKSVLKRGKNTSAINSTELDIGCKLKGDKSTIISLLKKHYGDTWEENPDLSFLKEALVTSRAEQDNMPETDVESGCRSIKPCDINLPI